MFGPLPRLHTLLVIVTTLAVGVGLGAWLGQVDTGLLATGLALGVVLASVASWVLLHDFRHHRTRHS